MNSPALQIHEEEMCLIPMGGVLPRHPQRTLGIGGTAGMVHPSTGALPSQEQPKCTYNMCTYEFCFVRPQRRETSNAVSSISIALNCGPEPLLQATWWHACWAARRQLRTPSSSSWRRPSTRLATPRCVSSGCRIGKFSHVAICPVVFPILAGHRQAWCPSHPLATSELKACVLEACCCFMTPLGLELLCCCPAGQAAKLHPDGGGSKHAVGGGVAHGVAAGAAATARLFHLRPEDAAGPRPAGAALHTWPFVGAKHSRQQQQPTAPYFRPTAS